MSLIPYTRALGPVLDRWFDDWDWGWDLRPASRTVFPPLDAHSDDEGLVVRLEVPGIPPEELSVEVHDRILTIKGEAAKEAEGKAERRAFQRSFRLPADLDLDRAEAKHEFGVLTLRIPRSEAAKPRTIAVKVH